MRNEAPVSVSSSKWVNSSETDIIGEGATCQRVLYLPRVVGTRAIILIAENGSMVWQGLPSSPSSRNPPLSPQSAPNGDIGCDHANQQRKCEYFRISRVRGKPNKLEIIRIMGENQWEEEATDNLGQFQWSLTPRRSMPTRNMRKELWGCSVACPTPSGTSTTNTFRRGPAGRTASSSTSYSITSTTGLSLF